MRLLHLVKSLDIGGVEKSTILYSNELSSTINYVGIAGLKGFFDDSNIIHKRVNRFYPPYKFENYLFFFSNILFLIKIIKKNKITHIHYHQRIFIPFIYVISLFIKKLKIIYSHQNVFHDRINYFIKANKVIALTKYAKNDLPTFLQKKAVVIPHGIILPPNPKPKERAINFGYVGRFVRWKGILELIDEFNKLCNQYSNVYLFLIGEGDLQNEIEAKINFLNLNNKIKIIAPKIILSEIYGTLDVLILPSRSLEGFGIVLIEAMANGIPVIVTNNPTFDDIVLDNYNGIIVDKKLFEAMRKLIIKNNLYQDLSRNAILFSQKFTVKKIVNKYLQNIY